MTKTERLKRMGQKGVFILFMFKTSIIWSESVVFVKNCNMKLQCKTNKNITDLITK